MQRLLGVFALGDVANVALNHWPSIDGIDVADKLHRDLPSVFGFKWQVLVADDPFRLQVGKGSLGGYCILKGADFPEFLPYEFSV